LDGDLQNDPADLPRMLEELDRCDMVCGVRIARADGALRRLSSRVARWARKLALRVDFADSGCSLRVFKRRMLEALPAFKGVHRFIPILASSAGAVVKEMPVSHHPRVAGRSNYGVWNRVGAGIFDLLMVAMLVRRQIKLDSPQPNEGRR
jgi:dolichol-phosphate mannosyltransferase